MFDPYFPSIAEASRRLALGGLAFLVVTRAEYPSEDADQGTGLVWILLLIAVSGLAVISQLLAGATRWRWSWVDGVVLGLAALVALSVRSALDLRPAIILAWEWAGMALVYMLARNLPRTRGESSDLTLILVATAVALATYGLFQVAVELPDLRARYIAAPEAYFRTLRIDPQSPSAHALEQRLLHSFEPFSTFALANSLAGVLVAGLTLLAATMLENLRRDGTGPRWGGLMIALVPALALGVCLLLTKSRSAYVGLGVASLLLAWHYWSLIPRRILLGGGLGLGVVLGVLITLGAMNRQLDIQVLSEARKSLNVRWEYWVATWGILTEAPPPYPVSSPTPGALASEEVSPSPSLKTFWEGLGPGNFAGPYRLHKLPEASEEIRDPHNLVLEVWAGSGFPAALALLGAIAGGIGLILRRMNSADRENPQTTPRRAHWRILVVGGMGWFGVWLLGHLSPIGSANDLRRWLVLGFAWFGAVGLLLPLWSRCGVPAIGLAAAALSLAVHLLAAGGIGYPSVAMILWLSLALGLNLRDDRAAGHLRERPGLGLAVVLASCWAALAGTYFGSILPIWRSDAELATGNGLLNVPAPAYEQARSAYVRAIAADRHSVEPWLALADLEYRFWQSPEAKARHKDNYTKVMLALDEALNAHYRDPNNLAVRERQVLYARTILRELPEEIKPVELLTLRSTIARAARQAVRLYPTSASLRASLAQANADLGMFREAAVEGQAALELNRRMPHLDRKLAKSSEDALVALVPSWEQKAKEPPPTAADILGKKP